MQHLNNMIQKQNSDALGRSKIGTYFLALYHKSERKKCLGDCGSRADCHYNIITENL